VLQAWRLPDQP